MYRDKRIGIIVPVPDEGTPVPAVLETLPAFADAIIVVTGGTNDRPAGEAASGSVRSRRDIVFVRPAAPGTGDAVIRGYQQFLENGELDIAVLIPPETRNGWEDLPGLLDAIIDGEADYAKGNRLFTGRAWTVFPRGRYLADSWVSFLTKMASGYWHVADARSRYTAITRGALKQLMLDRIRKGEGMFADILIHLNAGRFRVADIPVEPFYPTARGSGPGTLKVTGQLILGFFWRLKEKYVIRDFHPLIFFYALGLLTIPAGVLFGTHILLLRIFTGPVAATSALFAGFLCITGAQALFFAMWMDMQDNPAVY